MRNIAGGTYRIPTKNILKAFLATRVARVVE